MLLQASIHVTNTMQSIPKLIITEEVYDGLQDKNRLEDYLPSKLISPVIVHACTNIFAAPKSRVLLSSSFPAFTYINANYIKVWEPYKLCRYNLFRNYRCFVYNLCTYVFVYSS